MNCRTVRKHDYNRRMQHNMIKFMAACIVVLSIVTIVVLSGTAQAKEDSGLNKYYKTIDIQSGDTLWSIALVNSEGYGSINDYIIEVKELNSIGDGNITAGMKLLIPYMTEQSAQ